MKRIAILTGASSGMGRELALQLAQWETFDELWVIARRADRLEALKEQVRDKLNESAKELYGIDNFADMVGDETITEDAEELLNFLTEHNHPVLGMEPLL